MLVNYYYAAEVAINSGDKDGDLRAKVCGSELRGERFGTYGPGDCSKLAQAWTDKLKAGK